MVGDLIADFRSCCEMFYQARSRSNSGNHSSLLMENYIAMRKLILTALSFLQDSWKL